MMWTRFHSEINYNLNHFIFNGGTSSTYEVKKIYPLSLIHYFTLPPHPVPVQMDNCLHFRDICMTDHVLVV